LPESAFEIWLHLEKKLMDTKSLERDRDGVLPNPSLWEGTEGGYLLRMLAGLLLKPLEAIAMECVWMITYHWKFDDI